MQAEQIHGARKALGLAALAFFTCFYVWSLYGPLSPAIQHDLGLSEVQLGYFDSERLGDGFVPKTWKQRRESDLRGLQKLATNTTDRRGRNAADTTYVEVLSLAEQTADVR